MPELARGQGFDAPLTAAPDTLRSFSHGEASVAFANTSQRMSVELERHLSQLHHDQEHYERFVDFMATVLERSEAWGVAKSLAHGSGLALQSHRHFLPAAQAYLEHVRRHGALDARRPEARAVRGRLGSAARQMYAAQRPVFDLTLDWLLLAASVPAGGIPLAAAIAIEATPFKRQLQDRCWGAFKRAEQRWLAHARQQAAH